MTKKLVNVFIAVLLALLAVFILFTSSVAIASAATITSENFPDTASSEIIKSLEDGDEIEGKFFRFFIEDTYSTFEDGAWVGKNSYIVYLDENKEQKIQWSAAGDGFILIDVKMEGNVTPFIIPSKKITTSAGQTFVDFYVGLDNENFAPDQYVTGFYEDGVDEDGNIVVSQRIDELNFKYSDGKPDNKDNATTPTTPAILGGLIVAVGAIIIICEVKRR